MPKHRFHGVVYAEAAEILADLDAGVVNTPEIVVQVVADTAAAGHTYLPPLLSWGANNTCVLIIMAISILYPLKDREIPVITGMKFLFCLCMLEGT
jgi:hypothetical protein